MIEQMMVDPCNNSTGTIQNNDSVSALSFSLGTGTGTYHDHDQFKTRVFNSTNGATGGLNHGSNGRFHSLSRRNANDENLDGGDLYHVNQQISTLSDPSFHLLQDQLEESNNLQQWQGGNQSVRLQQQQEQELSQLHERQVQPFSGEVSNESAETKHPVCVGGSSGRGRDNGGGGVRNWPGGSNMNCNHLLNLQGPVSPPNAIPSNLWDQATKMMTSTNSMAASAGTKTGTPVGMMNSGKYVQNNLIRCENKLDGNLSRPHSDPNNNRRSSSYNSININSDADMYNGNDEDLKRLEKNHGYEDNRNAMVLWQQQQLQQQQQHLMSSAPLTATRNNLYMNPDRPPQHAPVLNRFNSTKNETMMALPPQGFNIAPSSEIAATSMGQLHFPDIVANHSNANSNSNMMHINHQQQLVLASSIPGSVHECDNYNTGYNHIICTNNNDCTDNLSQQQHQQQQNDQQQQQLTIMMEKYRIQQLQQQLQQFQGGDNMFNNDSNHQTQGHVHAEHNNNRYNPNNSNVNSTMHLNSSTNSSNNCIYNTKSHSSNYVNGWNENSMLLSSAAVSVQEQQQQHQQDRSNLLHHQQSQCHTGVSQQLQQNLKHQQGQPMFSMGCNENNGTGTHDILNNRQTVTDGTIMLQQQELILLRQQQEQELLQQQWLDEVNLLQQLQQQTHHHSSTAGTSTITTSTNELLPSLGHFNVPNNMKTDNFLPLELRLSTTIGNNHVLHNDKDQQQSAIFMMENKKRRMEGQYGQAFSLQQGLQPQHQEQQQQQLQNKDDEEGNQFRFLKKYKETNDSHGTEGLFERATFQHEASTQNQHLQRTQTVASLPRDMIKLTPPLPDNPFLSTAQSSLLNINNQKSYSLVGVVGNDNSVVSHSVTSKSNIPGSRKKRAKTFPEKLLQAILGYEKAMKQQEEVEKQKLSKSMAESSNGTTTMKKKDTKDQEEDCIDGADKSQDDQEEEDIQEKLESNEISEAGTDKKSTPATKTTGDQSHRLVHWLIVPTAVVPPQEQEQSPLYTTQNPGSNCDTNKDHDTPKKPECTNSSQVGTSSTTVSSSPTMASFVITDPDAFVTRVLNPVFKQAKYASFVRKLHRWGFVRLSTTVPCTTLTTNNNNKDDNDTTNSCSKTGKGCGSDTSNLNKGTDITTTCVQPPSETQTDLAIGETNTTTSSTTNDCFHHPFFHPFHQDWVAKISCHHHQNSLFPNQQQQESQQQHYTDNLNDSNSVYHHSAYDDDDDDNEDVLFSHLVRQNQNVQSIMNQSNDAKNEPHRGFIMGGTPSAQVGTKNSVPVMLINTDTRVPIIAANTHPGGTTSNDDSNIRISMAQEEEGNDSYHATMGREGMELQQLNFLRQQERAMREREQKVQFQKEYRHQEQGLEHPNEQLQLNEQIVQQRQQSLLYHPGITNTAQVDSILLHQTNNNNRFSNGNSHGSNVRTKSGGNEMVGASVQTPRTHSNSVNFMNHSKDNAKDEQMLRSMMLLKNQPRPLASTIPLPSSFFPSASLLATAVGAKEHGTELIDSTSGIANRMLTSTNTSTTITPHNQLSSLDQLPPTTSRAPGNSQQWEHHMNLNSEVRYKNNNDLPEKVVMKTAIVKSLDIEKSPSSNSVSRGSNNSSCEEGGIDRFIQAKQQDVTTSFRRDCNHTSSSNQRVRLRNNRKCNSNNKQKGAKHKNNRSDNEDEEEDSLSSLEDVFAPSSSLQVNNNNSTKNNNSNNNERLRQLYNSK